jgi:hypothetical protein
MRPVKTAVVLKTIDTPKGPDGSTGNTGEQILLRLSPPLRKQGGTHQFVVASAAYMPQGYNGPREPEVAVFASNPKGVIEFGTLLHMEHDTDSHEKAMKALGYELVDLR